MIAKLVGVVTDDGFAGEMVYCVENQYDLHFQPDYSYGGETGDQIVGGVQITYIEECRKRHYGSLELPVELGGLLQRCMQADEERRVELGNELDEWVYTFIPLCSQE